MLDFLDDYWYIVGSKQGTELIRQNKHFESLTYLLRHEAPGGIAEAKIPARYRPWKKWDLCFPEHKIAIEFKSVTSKSIEKCKYLRVEEALGSAIDIKKLDDSYRLGFLLVFALNTCDHTTIKARDYMLAAFESMVEDGVYDFFCPLQTMSLGNHFELSSRYTFSNFIKFIRNEDIKDGFVQRCNSFHSANQEGSPYQGERKRLRSIRGQPVSVLPF